MTADVPGRSPVGDVPIVVAGEAAAGQTAVASAAEGGQLLSYTDNGTPGNVGPANVIVGAGGFEQFWPYSAGANASGGNRIYAVNDKGQLLSFTDNGAPGNVSTPVVVGFGGWQQFLLIFAGQNALGENRIYATNHQGQLLSYTDNGTPGNVGPANVIVGADGWLLLQSLFAGRNALGENRIYAVFQDGKLLSYTDNGTPGNVGHPVTVGAGGWGQFQFLFAGANALGENRIYAVNHEGQLLSYTDNGKPGNVGHPVVVGFGAWGEFQSVFAGANSAGENHIYAVTQPAGGTTGGGSGGGGGGGGGTSTASLTAAVGEPPQSPSNSGLRIEGNNFGANETVEVTVDWKVLGESALFPMTAQTNSLGYFQAWFTGNTPDGLCPYSVAEGQPQPPQYFSVSATGMTSHKTASTSAGPFTCI